MICLSARVRILRERILVLSCCRILQKLRIQCLIPYKYKTLACIFLIILPCDLSFLGNGDRPRSVFILDFLAGSRI